MRLRRLSNFVSAAVVASSALLNVAIVPFAGAAADTCTWTGGGSNDNFSTAANWSGCDAAGIPENGDSVVFSRTGLTADTTVNNDITGLSLAGLTFSGTSSTYNNYIISGNALTLTGDVTLADSNWPSFNLDVTAGANVAVTGSGGVYLGHYSSPTNTHTVALGARTLTKTGGAGIVSYSKITGTGTITGDSSGTLNILGDMDGFSGNVSASGGSVRLVGKLPTGQIDVNGSATLALRGCDISANLALSGTNSIYTPKLYLQYGTACAPTSTDTSDDTIKWSEYNEWVGSDTLPTGGAITLGGTITLGNDITFQTDAKTATVTSAITGSHAINILKGGTGSLVLQSSNNASSTSNGTYGPSARESLTVADDQTSNNFLVEGYSSLTVDGKVGNVALNYNALLNGTGTVGNLYVSRLGTVAPGHSPGIINSGNLTMNGTYEFELAGPTAGTQYDQIKVTGTVALDPATAELRTVILPGYSAVAGQKYVIVDNDGADAVTGTFMGLAQGATFTVGSGQFRISYTGGDGNDIELTVLTVPGSPDTGFKLLSANPALTLAFTVLGAGALFVAARRIRA
jgi:fibronectin-binding autotransporter adhesin